MNDNDELDLGTPAELPHDDFRCGTVALAGRPNVGKSTLLNALIGVRLSIVSHRPQTTRHRILGISTKPQGQILYVDTPGLHRGGKRAMNRAQLQQRRGHQRFVRRRRADVSRWLRALLQGEHRHGDSTRQQR